MAADLLDSLSASLEDEVGDEFAGFGAWYVAGQLATLLASMAAAVHLAPKKSQLPATWVELAPRLLEVLPALMQDSRLAGNGKNEPALGSSCYCKKSLSVTCL